jgi:thiamine pyrophosphate-dependent acetolactate synthase large subunit-like protein
MTTIFGNPGSTELPRLDITRIAEGFGYMAETVEEPDKLEEALLRALGHEGPYLVNVIAQPVSTSAASRRPYCSMAVSRSLYFWILPLAVIGYSSTNST